MKRHIDHLFVYGTLRPAMRHVLQDALRRHARWLGAGWVAGRLYDLGRYPGLVPDARGVAVRGDVYRLRQQRALLTVLDRYEGCAPRMPVPREYRRMPVLVRWKRRRMWAWVYVYGRPTEGLQEFPDGDYLHAARSRRDTRTGRMGGAQRNPSGSMPLSVDGLRRKAPPPILHTSNTRTCAGSKARGHPVG